ncbi:MAG: hypothetical protein LBE12_04315 [Planctomycetaceae bacterium]|jgi:hypothetical protein|nr:hypothetical protein [Planctomycetaceae bacterium]
MQHIPVAKLTRGSAVLMVYYDDYWEDIANDTMRRKKIMAGQAPPLTTGFTP